MKTKTEKIDQRARTRTLITTKNHNTLTKNKNINNPKFNLKKTNHNKFLQGFETFSYVDIITTDVNVKNESQRLNFWIQGFISDEELNKKISYPSSLAP